MRGNSARRVGLVAISAAMAAAVSLPLLLLASTSAADPLSSAQAEASALTKQIQAEGQRLDVLSQQYDAAQQQVQQLSVEMAQTDSNISVTKEKVSAAEATLRRQALSDYMNGTDGSLDALFASGGSEIGVAQEYRTVAAGNLSTSIDSLHQLQAQLSSEESQLQATETQAQAAQSQAAAARQSAQATQQQEQQTLGRVKGQIATLVAEQQAAEARAQQQAFEARVAAQAAAASAAARRVATSSSGSITRSASGLGPVVTTIAVAPGGEGAVAAARSQLGVPYVWGGESPGRGFDCSGLTQWAWRQAGVSLPRTAQAQYDAIVHIPLSSLEPGDLLFWNDGTSSIQHVAMYVGGGEVIQAPETGETVSYAGIWNNGLVGAGRP